jgi:membrane protein
MNENLPDKNEKIEEVNLIKKINYLSPRNIYRFLEHIYDEADKNHVYLIASGISFNILLYVVPLLLLVVYVITIFFEPEFAIKIISKLIKEALPRKIYSKELITNMREEINYLFEYRALFGFFGVFTILWISSALVSSLRYGLNLIFEVKESKLGIVYRFKDMLLTLMFTILILLYSFILPGLKLVLSLISQIDLEVVRYYLSGFVINSLTLSISIILYVMIYRLVPSKNIGYKIIFTSTIITILFLELLSYLFSIYVEKFDSYGKVYGSLGIIIALAMWLYYSSLIILLSTIISKTIYSFKPKE